MDEDGIVRGLKGMRLRSIVEEENPKPLLPLEHVPIAGHKGIFASLH